ncbi:MAG: biotin--[acetyl-CoA-carboxylase] ligase [Cyclobacteriaceae bacterium]|nr:biotin--[acetyl-CoA-carboxylase] ligase [Cyclobacteriaceae bacterium]
MYKIPANTLFIGQHLVFVPECHSTNLELQRLMQQKGSAEGLIVITDNQTAGRGQRGNTWESEPGKNLTFSVGLKPNFISLHQQFYLSMAVSLGLYDCLLHFLPNETIKIKWPNDIMVNDKKVCGMLIENQIVNQRIDRSVVGIGLNVNQRFFPLPQATSMNLECEKVFDLNTVFSMLLEKIEARYLCLKPGGLQKLKQTYEQNLYWREELHEFIIDEQTQQGIVKGVSEEGKLCVLIKGELKSFVFKEIRYAY